MAKMMQMLNKSKFSITTCFQLKINREMNVKVITKMMRIMTKIFRTWVLPCCSSMLRFAERKWRGKADVLNKSLVSKLKNIWWEGDGQPSPNGSLMMVKFLQYFARAFNSGFFNACGTWNLWILKTLTSLRAWRWKKNWGFHSNRTQFPSSQAFYLTTGWYSTPSPSSQAFYLTTGWYSTPNLLPNKLSTWPLGGTLHPVLPHKRSTWPLGGTLHPGLPHKRSTWPLGGTLHPVLPHKLSIWPLQSYSSQAFYLTTTVSFLTSVLSDHCSLILHKHSI